MGGHIGGERKVVEKKATRRIGKVQRYVSNSLTVRSLLRNSGNWRIGARKTRLVLRSQRQAANGGRVVVLKHIFTLDGLEEDSSLLLDLKEEVREKCATPGDVTNVILCDVREFLISLFFSRYISLIYSYSKSQRA